MSAACKTILKTLHARGAKPPPGARRMATSPHPHVLRAKELADFAARRHPARRETAAQAAVSLRRLFRPRPPAPPADTRAVRLSRNRGGAPAGLALSAREPALTSCRDLTSLRQLLPNAAIAALTPRLVAVRRAAYVAVRPHPVAA